MLTPGHHLGDIHLPTAEKAALCVPSSHNWPFSLDGRLVSLQKNSSVSLKASLFHLVPSRFDLGSICHPIHVPTWTPAMDKSLLCPPLLATNGLDIFWLAGVPSPVTATPHLGFVYFVRGRGGGGVCGGFSFSCFIKLQLLCFEKWYLEQVSEANSSAYWDVRK